VNSHRGGKSYVGVYVGVECVRPKLAQSGIHDIATGSQPQLSQPTRMGRERSGSRGRIPQLTLSISNSTDVLYPER
jgi:hypothetical protein